MKVSFFGKTAKQYGEEPLFLLEEGESCVGILTIEQLAEFNRSRQ